MSAEYHLGRFNQIGVELNLKTPFNENARKALVFAEEESERLRHQYIGTAHLLLGLTRPIAPISEGNPPQLSEAGQILESQGITLNRTRSAVEFIIGRGDRLLGEPIGFTPRARDAIELATVESRQAGRIEVTDIDLLLGIVRLDEGVAAGVIESLGVSSRKIEAAVVKATTA